MRILLLVLLLFSWTQITTGQSNISGTILDRSNQPVEGAIVAVKGSMNYGISDSTGQFTIQFKQTFPLILVISAVGYTSDEINLDALPEQPLQIQIVEDSELAEVLVTARRRSESAQDVPIPISVLNGSQLEKTGAFNVNRMKELVPSVQLYSSNPRNTGLSIRGLGTTFGLTNDGIDPGVGFYVDGVYYARTAATTMDFIDVEQIEILRGPQGTLFGKNTMAGAFNITTKKPSFDPQAKVEISAGNYGFVQVKGTATGAITKTIAGRLSLSATRRDGLLENVETGKLVNDLNNLGLRGQLLFTPSEKIAVTLIGDVTRQRPTGYAQVFAGVAPTLRAEYRQFENIIADLNYQLPSTNPFDRKIDHDTPWKSNQDLGGLSVNADIKLGAGTLTSTSAWCYWNWDPSNDRDFTGLPVLTLSQAPSQQEQWSQEVRYSGTLSSKFSGVIGVFVFGQNLQTDPYHTEESGAAQWRFSRNSTNALWETPGLLDGYGIRTHSNLRTLSAAVFSQVDWSLTKRIHVLLGVRYNHDRKEVDFKRETYGGLQTEDPALIALKNSVYSNQEFQADIDNNNLSGQLTFAYKASEQLHAFATFSTAYKPVGLNLGGLPTANGAPLLELAVIKSESAQHWEFGLKSIPFDKAKVNLVLYNTDIYDYQVQVQTADLSVNRGYLANAEHVRVRGVEVDATFQLLNRWSIHFATAYTDGAYVSFTNAPPPLEETGGPTFKDISGSVLPGISKWAGSFGAEYNMDGKLFGKEGVYFVAGDFYARSSFSSNPSPSTYLVINGYTLLNPRVGFRVPSGWSVHLWSRNILDTEYFEQLLPGSGNAGHYAAVLGDPRTFGITAHRTF